MSYLQDRSVALDDGLHLDRDAVLHRGLGREAVAPGADVGRDGHLDIAGAVGVDSTLLRV